MPIPTLSLWLLSCLIALAGTAPLHAAPGVVAPGAPPAGSQERWINGGWKFFRADGAEPSHPEAATFDDAGWQAVTLPHTPRIEKYDATHPWQGVCWYRRALAPDPTWAGKRVSVQFGAAMQVADVWVNGVHAVRHLGGYLPFTVDVTDQAAAGGAVVLAARLDNRDTKLVPPGKETDGLDFNYPGGLYRGVKLIVTDPVHVTDAVEANVVAGGGVFVTYSDVSDARATVHVQTDVANDGDGLAHKVTVRSAILDADGTAVAQTVSPPVLISAHDHHEFGQALTVPHPRLWSPDAPNRYVFRTTVSRGGTPVDQIDTRIGIRSFVLDTRLRVNGKEVRIIGSNRHQEYPYLEYALSPDAGRRDAQRIKDGGFNFIRLSHYPQDPAFLDACDELGILVQAAIPGWQTFPDNPAFVSGTYQNIRDMMRRDRNHPSVVFWETNLNETGPPADWSRTAWEIAHQEYPGPECYTFGDAAAAPWTPGWDVKHFWREYGDFGFGGNESTSRQARGGGEAAMLQQAWNFQWDDNNIRKAFDAPGGSFYGDATWCMFDYNRGYYPKQERSGMMDIFRLPKYVYHFYQSQRDPNVTRPDAQSGPMVFIASDWAKRGPTTRVVVFSNCDEIELSVNGKVISRQKPDAGPDSPYSARKANIAATVGTDYDPSGGTTYDGGNAKHLDHAPFTFTNVPYAPGAVRAIGYLNGQAATESTIRTPEAPAALSVEFDTQRRPLVADGADAVFVRASIRDKNGTVVPVNAWPSLHFAVSGPAHLVPTDTLHVEAGVASALLQATDQPGAIRVSVTGDGLKAASAALTSQPYDPVVSRAPTPPAPKAAGPIPTHFTKLTGTILGTPGSYANGPAVIGKAFDGDTATFVDADAATNGVGCWIGLDLGTPKRITKIRYFPRQAFPQRVVGAKFQGSDTADFQNPTDLCEVEAAPPDGQWGETTDLNTAQPFRYVRFLSPDDGYNNVAELEFYTSP